MIELQLYKIAQGWSSKITAEEISLLEDPTIHDHHDQSRYVSMIISIPDRPGLRGLKRLIDKEIMARAFGYEDLVEDFLHLSSRSIHTYFMVHWAGTNDDNLIRPTRPNTDKEMNDLLEVMRDRGWKDHLKAHCYMREPTKRERAAKAKTNATHDFPDDDEEDIRPPPRPAPASSRKPPPARTTKSNQPSAGSSRRAPHQAPESRTGDTEPAESEDIRKDYSIRDDLENYDIGEDGEKEETDIEGELEKFREDERRNLGLPDTRERDGGEEDNSHFVDNFDDDEDPEMETLPTEEDDEEESPDAWEERQSQTDAKKQGQILQAQATVNAASSILKKKRPSTRREEEYGDAGDLTMQPPIAKKVDLGFATPAPRSKVKEPVSGTRQGQKRALDVESDDEETDGKSASKQVELTKESRISGAGSPKHREVKKGVRAKKSKSEK